VTDNERATKGDFEKRKELLEWAGEKAFSKIEAMAAGMVERLSRGGSVFACGNGGSASQAEHFAAELAGRFKQDRKSLSAWALSINSSSVTAIANDYGFSEIFARQLEGIATEKDCLLALSTSGNSENVVKACQVAKRGGMRIYAMTGHGGGLLAGNSDLTLEVPDTDAARIQEIHLLAVHLICQIVEERMFSPARSPSEDA
jgi:D-sedoheptulose 7-phosphate isomerase